MRSKKETKLKRRLLNRNLWPPVFYASKFAGKIESCGRAIFGYIKFFSKRIDFNFLPQEHILRKVFVIFLVFAWLFNGWPAIWQNPRIPPKIPEARADGATDAMMVYDTQDITSTPKYRLWNGSSWGSETSANTVSGEIRYMVVRYAPTRDEAIMAVLTSTGQIQAQVFNGTSWGSPEIIGTMYNSNGDRDIQSQYRGFDLEYEQTSGDAIIIYGDGTADPDYKVWNGTSWSSATNIDIPNTGVPNWIELASRPGSDELAMILIDANADVFGARWTGSSWDLMGQSAVWDDTAAIATEKCIDVAFETNSGDIMFIWADSVSTDNYYKTYSSGSLSANTLLDQPTAGGVGNWVKLASNPTAGSDQIMFGVVDAGSDINTAMWSGSAWGTFTEHDSSVEAHDEMIFDIVFETHSSNPNDAWLVYGDGATVARRLWDGGSSSWNTITTSGDDSVYMALNAHPNSGAVFAGVYEDVTAATDDITSMQLTGGSQTWSSPSIVWSGPVGRRAYFLVDIASQVYGSSTEAMMVYDTRSITSAPKYRRWTGSSWSSEANANSVNGEIRHAVLKFSPTRNEAILATLGSTGELMAQIWNGSIWSSPELIGIMYDANGDRDTQSLYRGFDLEYENTSGDAIIIYGDGTADPNYKVWNGTSWSSATNIDIPNTGVPNWIELASRPGSDELAMILIDVNVDVFGARWTGSAWDLMGQSAVWDTTGSIATRKSVDVAFETTSGDIMFIWGDATATDQYYRTYTGSLSGATLLDISTAGGVVHWARLASNPTSGSNQIMYGALDAGSDLNTAIWDGTSTWTVHAEHSDNTEDVVDMNFDIVFETHSNNPNDAWLVWGDGATVSRKLYNGETSSWGTATTSGDDTALVVLAAQPQSGAVFALIYEDDTSATDDITTIQLTGGSQTWSSPTQIWAGPVAANRGSFRITIASERAVSGAITTDIVDASYNPVSNPTMAMNSATFSFACQTVTGTFGTASQRIYVNNNNGANNGWTLTLAAQATTNVWDSAGTDYDFNDPTSSGCADGGDADSVAGQMTVDPSVGTLTVGKCSNCTTNNISKGSSAAFSEGTTDTITLLSATAASDDVGDWVLTGVSISQKIPAEQPAANDYDINMVLTVTAN